METVNIHEAKTNLSRLIRCAEAGEEVVIARAGEPVAKLVQYKPAKLKRRRFGAMRGKIWIADDFDAPLPESIAAAFRGERP
jgi:prevent-host-death family protein